ncbi:MAG TPA: glycosyltransferase [Verrucomicrobiae bacterium]|nr:glycosyltransferase [Verrucomicrobiae bacterium]
MPSVALILAGITLLIWIVLTFFRGAFWLLRPFDDDIAPHPTLAVWPRVVCVMPARNEAETIARAVASLAKQEYPGALRIVIVDDQSEDATSALAKAAAQEAGAADRVRILQAEALRSGWTGKLWALQQGIASCQGDAPEYFWFTDADITHAPDTLARLVSHAEQQHSDLVSLMVLLQAKSFPERLLIPPFLYFFLKLYPPRWIADTKAKMAGAAGGCILLRRTALERIGGFAAIRGEVIDDCALARAVKHSGGAIWMGLTRRSVSLRTYQTFGEIRDLIARTAFTQLKYSSVLLLGTLAGILLTYVAPVVLAFYRQAAVWRLGLAAWLLMAVTYLPTVRFYGLSPLWAPFLPVAAAFYSYATWLSAARYWLGRGGQWKGRAQAVSARRS